MSHLRDRPGAEPSESRDRRLILDNEPSAAARPGAIGPRPYFTRIVAELASGRLEPPLTVVVIDDDEGVRRGLARLLRALGFEAETYDSADAFLGRSGADTDICLVLDIHLRRMSGLVLADWLDQQGRSIPIVFMSAQEGSLPEPRGSHKGTIAFLRKPFDESVLLEAVSRARGACREATPAV